MQLWTFIHAFVLGSTLVIMVSVSSARTKLKVSQTCYSLTLLFILIATFIQMIGINMPLKLAHIVPPILMITLIFISLAASFFSLCGISLAKSPGKLEAIFCLLPIPVALASMAFSGPEIEYTDWGYSGVAIKDLGVRIIWYASIILVIGYACLYLFRIGREIANERVRRRIIYFILSGILAVTSGITLTSIYIILGKRIPFLSLIAINLSFLIAYPIIFEEI